MADYSKKRFLVIDDLPLAREALRIVAQTMGAFAVEFASTYQDAIYRMRNNTPDIILCDYMLGEDRGRAAKGSGPAELTKISTGGRAQDPNVPSGLGEGPSRSSNSGPRGELGALKKKGNVQSKED